MKNFIIILITCMLTPQNQMTFTIHHQQDLLGIPSASGVVKHKKSYYIIGDDSPFLFQLNRDFQTVAKYPVQEIKNLPETGRIEKRVKPDFEALELVNENEIMVFGSGSKSPERDLLLRISIGDSVSVKQNDLREFYRKLRKSTPLENRELNIEAVAFHKDWLYLFNRGKNVIFRVSYNALLDHLDKGSTAPDFDYTEFELPEIEGIQAGFSGATIDKGTGMVLLTASVEDTPNAYDDGEVLGSLIGVFTMENERVHPYGRWVRIENLNNPLKIESITIDKNNAEGDMDIILVSDSDGGCSRLLKANLRY